MNNQMTTQSPENVPSDAEILANMRERGWIYMDDEEENDIIGLVHDLFAKYAAPATVGLHDIDAGLEVMGWLRENGAPHMIYAKMSACLFGDPERKSPTPPAGEGQEPVGEDRDIAINRLIQKHIGQPARSLRIDCEAMLREAMTIPAPQAAQPAATADVQTVIRFIFDRFGAPGESGELPEAVVQAVRRLEVLQPAASVEPVEGWQTVPAQPSIAMCVRGAVVTDNAIDGYLAAKVYAAMLHAAPIAAQVQPEARAEAYIQAAVDQAPDPMRRLGEWLSKTLDEDQWRTAERMLLGAMIASAQDASKPAQETVEQRLEREACEDLLTPDQPAQDERGEP